MKQQDLWWKKVLMWKLLTLVIESQWKIIFIVDLVINAKWEINLLLAYNMFDCLKNIHIVNKF